MGYVAKMNPTLGRHFFVIVVSELIYLETTFRFVIFDLLLERSRWESLQLTKCSRVTNCMSGGTTTRELLGEPKGTWRGSFGNHEGQQTEDWGFSIFLKSPVKKAFAIIGPSRMSHWALNIGGAFEWTCISIRGVLYRSSRKPGYWGFQDSIGADDGFVFFWPWNMGDCLFRRKWFGNGVKIIWKSANAHPSNGTPPKTWPALPKTGGQYSLKASYFFRGKGINAHNLLAVVETMQCLNTQCLFSSQLFTSRQPFTTRPDFQDQ